MKKALTIILLFFATAAITNAQEWYKDIEKAKQEAQETNKKIILVFSGSDWCAPCMKLEKKIWNSDSFKAYAKDHYVMVKADFPRRKKNRLSKEQQEKNNKLAEQYNNQGFFPHVVIMNPKGKVLGTAGYKSISPEDYIKLLDSF